MTFALRVLLAVAVLATASGCTAMGYCCGRVTDFDETTRSDRRKVKKELREEKREELEEAAEDLFDEAKDLREESLEAYYAWLAKSLDLPAVWSEKRNEPGFVRAWRLTTLDGAYGEAGGFAGARLVAVPDWYFLVTAALKKKFDTEFDKGDRDGLARDLWRGERWAINHLDSGIAGIDVELSIAAEDMPPGFGPVLRVIGTARTDTEGRASLNLAKDAVPGSVPPMAYELTGRPLNAPAKAPALERDEAGHLFVRRGAAKPVVFVDANDVLDWTREAPMRSIVEQERFTVRDGCVKDAFTEMSRTHTIAVIAAEPDSLVPVFRRGLADSGATSVHPRSVALHFADNRITIARPEMRLSQLATHADRYRVALGTDGVAGLVTSNAALAESLAKTTGLTGWTLASPGDGGWCAGLPGLLAPKK